MAVDGAAYAKDCADSISCVLILLYTIFFLKKDKELWFAPKLSTFTPSGLWSYLRISIPMGAASYL